MALLTYAFVTLAEVKTQLGISDSSEDDKLEFLVNAATDLIEKYCGRRFIQAQYTDEIYDGENTNRLFVKNYPIDTAVAPTVKVDDEAVTVEAVNYPKGIIEIESFANDDLSNIKITYKGGYLLADIPFDLKQAAILMVARARNVSKNSGIASESVGDYSVTYSGVREAMTKDVKAILVNHKIY